MDQSYNHKKIEQFWQKKWIDDATYKTTGEGKPKQFILDMFPYPSGEGLHVGHPRGYIATDVYSRMKRMQGFDVLHPMGWDAFGLPAENFAIKNKVHPSVAVEKNIARFKEQLSIIGLDYDWSREINTTDPEFYKWTQWIFLQMFKKGLAYESYEPINWCPSCQTGLANEDVEADGTCERCGTVVEKKPMRQWVLKITDYADRMLTDLDKLPKWPNGVKEAQRHWIGKSEGSEIEFKLKVESDVVSETFKFRPELAELIKKGEKNVTFRMEQKNVSIGDVVSLVDWADGNKENQKEFLKARITKISEFKLIDLPLDYPGHEKDPSVTERLVRYQGFFGNHITNDSKVFVYEFEPLAISVFTTRADTLFGATYIALAPEHELILELKNQITNFDEVVRYIEPVKNKSDLDRQQSKDKTGVEVKGIKAINPANGEEISVWVADYVLAGYGTGVVMAVPAHDERDFEFAKKYNLPIRAVIKPIVLQNHGEERGVNFIYDILDGKICYTGEGLLTNSSQFDLRNNSEVKEEITKSIGGKIVKNYKIKDWVFARQRYWGEPIPIIHCEKCGAVAVPESELPVKLPEVQNYEPSGTGESPLANITDWVSTTCPECGGPAKRETNTMPQWAGSSWYYLRFIDPKNSEALVDKEKEKNWTPVDVYVGGDHATRHLIYARFWHKFLFDIGAVSTEEPFPRLEFLGFILASDGRKMSKRWGNIVNPDEMVDRFGADAFRLYEMFIGPFEYTAKWNTDGVVGTYRFLEKVWKIVSEKKFTEESDKNIKSLLNKTIKKVSEDIEGFKFNTAVSSMMIFMNEASSGSISQTDFKSFLKILAPFAPHMTEELYQQLTADSSELKADSIHLAGWPKFDESLIINESINIAVSFNGKGRGALETPTDSSEEEVINLIFDSLKFNKYIESREQIKKVIFVPNRIINIIY